MTKAIKLSVLDLCPILSGKSSEESLKQSVELARFVEDLQFERYWVAEHHDMAGIGSSAPEILISHIAQSTKKIRVGPGGIMLPNHSALHVAVVFKTLTALYGDRIDLGLGRAPGTGAKASHFLRSMRNLSVDDFPEQLELLEKFFDDSGPVAAIPVNVPRPEMWMLGSSDFGARLAAERGMPYSFAQHFSHLPAIEVIRMYKDEFRPSRAHPKPRAMMGTHIICADTDEEAQDLALSTELSFSLFVQTGKSSPLPTVAEAKAYPYTDADWRMVKASAFPKMVGSPDTIKKRLAPYLKSGIDEFIVLTMVHDQEKRKRSYQLLNNLLSEV